MFAINTKVARVILGDWRADPRVGGRNLEQQGR
jgi:hypothetical protein